MNSLNRTQGAYFSKRSTSYSEPKRLTEGQVEATDTPARGGRRNLVFDAFRLVAMSLVFWQHVSSTTDNVALCRLGSLTVGQLGVAIFIAISGWFAGVSKREPNQWLWQRFCQIYPAYFTVMLVALLAAGLTNYKAVGWDLAISQLLGVAALRYGEHIVNVPTWFITLVLVCYLATWIIRRTSMWLSVGMALTFAWASTQLHGFESLFTAHASTYFAIFWMARKQIDLALVVAITFYGIVGCLIENNLLYCLVGIIAVWAGARCNLSSNSAMRMLADYTYPFYLVHGPIIVALVMLLGARFAMVAILAMFLATGCSIVLEFFLRAMNGFGRWLQGRLAAWAIV